MPTTLLYFADPTSGTWKRRTWPDVSPPAAGWTRKSGPGYVRYEDLHVSGDTLQQTISRLTTDAVVTFPPGVFQFNDFAVATYYGLVLGSVGATHCKGLSGSGYSGANMTVIEMTPSSSSKSSYVSSLTTSDTNLLHLITTTSGMTNVELSGLHLRGTEQGHQYNGFHMQKNQTWLIDNVMISGVPGSAPTPPTECFGLNILGVTAANDIGIMQNSVVDGRRYDETTNVPGSRVGSSLVGVNAVGVQGTVSPSPLILFKNNTFQDGLYGPLALWHCYDLELDDCTFGGRLNQEETGRILYQRPHLIDPFGNGAVGQHFQQFNSMGDTTMLAPTWVVGLSAAGGKIATHQTNSAANPLIAHDSSGGKLSIYQQDESGFSTVVSR